MQIFVRDRSFYKKLITIALPISLQSLITIGVNMMDNIMLGAAGRSGNVGGVSGKPGFFSLFQIFCMGMGMGASVLISRYYGMQDIFSLKKSVTIMYRPAALPRAAVYGGSDCRSRFSDEFVHQ